MKLNGKKISGPNVEIIVIPRKDEDIVFKAQAVLSFDDFKKLCPQPMPPQMIKRGEGLVYDTENPQYKDALSLWQQMRMDWIIITSLRATPELEWEKVDFSNCDTWKLYSEELKDSGFGEYEVNRIVAGVMTANCLNETKIEEARKRFLAGPEAIQDALLSRNGEQSSTPSGERANA